MAEYDFEASIKWFVGQSQGMREGILATLESSKPAISIGALAAKIAKATGAEQAPLRSLLSFVGSLSIISPNDPEFIKSVVLIAVRTAWGESATPESKPEAARSFLRLFSCEIPVGLTGKAQDIIWGHGKVFKDAHTISQIRPLFRGDLEADANSAVIVHELKIEFREGETNESVSLVMDIEKIQKLQAILDRAIKKEKSLRKSALFDYLTAEEG